MSSQPIIRQSHHFDRGIINGKSMKRRFIPVVGVEAGIQHGIPSAKLIRLPAESSADDAERSAYEAFRSTIGAVSFTVEEEPA